MRFIRGKVAYSVVAAVALAFTATAQTPVHAGTTGTFTDGDGVDFDAACLLNTALSPPAPNSIASPGGSGCPGVSTYDGSAEMSDVRSVTLESTATSGLSLKATVVVDGALPAAGSTSLTAADLPDVGFTGASYRVMYQNPDRQNLLDDPAGGCTLTGGGREDDLQYPWQAGFHFYLEYGVGWDGLRWVHSVAVGEYDPTLIGGFRFTEIAHTTSTGAWTTVEPAMVGRWSASVTGSGPTTIVFEVSGVTLNADSGCQGGVYGTAYATPGDRIENVKVLATVDQVVTLPVSVLGFTTIGGFTAYADTSTGFSTAGLLNSNISGIAYSGGAVGFTDTLGLCVFTSCVVPDDHMVPVPGARGSLFSEFWETPYGFIA